MLAFLISALRATAEMLLLCLLGQAVLYVLAGNRREANRIYQLFALITRPPRRGIAMLMPGLPGAGAVGIATFLILLLGWIGLAFLRKFV